MNGSRKLTVLAAFIVFLCSFAQANNVYIANTAQGSNTGSDCADAYAYSYFNNPGNWASGTPTGTKIGPGTTVTVCNAITGAAGSTVLTFQGSGNSSNPITLTFASGASVQAPWCASAAGGSAGGCISADGKSYIVIDGNNLAGTVQNTLNGKSGASCPGGTCSYQQTSTLLDLQNCTNCTAQHLNIGPTYIELQNAASENSTNEVAVQVNGSNVVLSGNIIPNCGWCVQFFFNNNDTNFQTYDNSFTNFGHAYAVGPASANNTCASPCLFLHDNIIGPAGVNWDASGCPNHKDGLHIYDTGGSPSFGDIYVYNNFFGGDYGVCPTGYIFTETDFFANNAHYYLWNNVFQPSGTNFSNSNSWVYLGSMINSGSITDFFSNTFDDTTNTSGTVCVKQGYGSDTGTLNFRDNVFNGCYQPIYIDGPTTLGTFDTNFYGTGISQYQYHGTVATSLSSWKSACSCDASSIQSNSPGINSDGSLQSGSPARSAGANLSSFATGNLVTLQDDTTDGEQRTSSARPTGSTLWDIGAFQYQTSTTQAPAPPTGLAASVQ